jgi:hypothetical protein
MALTIIQNPDAIDFSGNPVIFKTQIESGDYATPGTYSNKYLLFARPAVADEFFTIWNVVGGVSVTSTYTAKTTPVLNNEIPAWDGVETVNAWLLRVKARLETLYYFSTYYVITVTGNYIYFTAVNYGAKYDIIYLTGSSGLVSSCAGTSGVISISECPICIYQIFTYDGAKWNKIAEDYSTYYALTTKTDIAQYINNILEAAYTYPNGTSYIVVHTISKLIFKIRCFLEFITGDNKVGVESGSFIAIQGKVPHYYAAQSNELAEALYTYFSVNKTFLSYAPQNKRSDLTAIEKLYFFVETCDHLKIGYKVYYSDNRTYSGLTAEQIITTSNIIEILVNKLTSLFDPAKTATKYEVWLEGAVGGGSYSQISETRTYTIDNTYYENRRQFLFKSDMYYDTIISRGIFETSIELTKEFIEIDLPEDFETNTRVKKQINTTILTEKVKANTGWITLDELHYFMQFFQSEDIFEITAEEKLIPIVITSTKYGKRKDDVFMYAAEFEYEKIAGTTAVMPEFGDFNDDFNNDFNI